MRLFLALDIPKQEKQKILELQDQLTQLKQYGNWQTDDQLHITLLFLGEVEEDNLFLLTQELSQIGFTAIPVAATACHWLPRADKPHNLVLAVKQHPVLDDLYQKLVRVAKKLSLPLGQRVFSPHVNIMRVKGKLPTALVKEIEQTKHEGFWKSHEFVLYKSDMKPDRAYYTALAHYPAHQ
ncbi:MAG: RNA 2',3'-cyclic phosphodiesterase [bacterium]